MQQRYTLNTETHAPIYILSAAAILIMALLLLPAPAEGALLMDGLRGLYALSIVLFWMACHKKGNTKKYSKVTLLCATPVAPIFLLAQLLKKAVSQLALLNKQQ